MMTSETHEENLTPVAPAPVEPVRPKRLTGREARRKRRKSRKRMEEVLAWILVPVILIAIWWAVTAGLEFLGTSPSNVWDQLMQVKQMLEKKM